MKLIRNITLLFPSIMWGYVAIASGFDMSIMMDVTVTCLLASVVIYFLPHTSKQFEEIDDAFMALSAMISRIAGKQ